MSDIVMDYDVNNFDWRPGVKLVKCLVCGRAQDIDANEADYIARSTGEVRCTDCNAQITIKIRGVTPSYSMFDVLTCLEEWASLFNEKGYSKE